MLDVDVDVDKLTYLVTFVIMINAVFSSFQITEVSVTLLLAKKFSDDVQPLL